MLTVLNELPAGLLDTSPRDLHRILSGPTLVHLPGRRAEPLFVSVLLHGDEETGWLALRELLRRHAGRELPRALSVFIGNVRAARERVRFLPGQPDYNRIWRLNPVGEAAVRTSLSCRPRLNPVGEAAVRTSLSCRPRLNPVGEAATAERAAAADVMAQMAARRVFASVDVHNNSGYNPHYACVTVLEARHLHLATLFSRTVVYFTQPDTVQAAAFAPLCPAVTIECGKPGEPHGVAHALEYLDACLHLSALPGHAVAAHDIDLFHTVATVKVPAGLSLAIGGEQADLRLIEDLDRLNFRELPAGTLLAGASARPPPAGRDEGGREVSARFFRIDGGEVRTTRPVMPSMLTLKLEAIRQDCLCYLMERHPGCEGVAAGAPARAT
jgi:hypothetical protein